MGDNMQKKITLKKRNTTREINYTDQDTNPNMKFIQETIKTTNSVKSFMIFGDESYNIYGYTSNKKSKGLSFSFDSAHPLYLPFLELLDDKDEIIINDAYTIDNDLLYLKIYKEDDVIYLKFINNLKYIDYQDRFNIYVMNNKLIVNSISDKLAIFFNNVFDTMVSNNQQITINDYLIRERSLKQSYKKK